MNKGSGSQFTDVMIAVPSLEEAVAFWKEVMGLVHADGDDGWNVMEDPQTH
jgi:catechol 2,3-dioxygenase-like lactoylglutathione lyase family enzyme